MTRAALGGSWSLISTAPRDGTPVILWLAEDDTPPVLPLTVGFWTPDDRIRAACWRIFGNVDGTESCADERVRGWKPLLNSGFS